MCGRFSFTASKEKIKEQFNNVNIDREIKVSYNIAPTHHAYVITNDLPDQLQLLTWGLIPYWSNDGLNKGHLINARKEGILSKPSFRIPIRKRRCLVLMDSFYEWRREGKQKVPYRIMMKNKSMMIVAGIWDEWQNGNSVVKSFSIITTSANSDVSKVHNRMPVILSNTYDQNQWLKEMDLQKVITLLKTIENGILKVYRIPVLVNSPKYNSRALYEEVFEPPSLF